MKATASRKPKQGESWPRKVSVGRESVSIYKRTLPNGSTGFMLASYASGRRKFISYASEADAIEAAGALARRLSETDTKAAQMTEEQAVEYVNAARELEPLGISLTAAVAAIVQAVKETGDLPSVAAATAFYKAKHKKITAKRVADAITEMIDLKKARGASVRYLQDLRSRMDRFAEKFQCNVGSVTTADLQAWLNGQKFSPQNYENYRRVLHLFFKSAVRLGYCLDNSAADVEKLKIHTGEIEIFKPDEARRLLATAPANFLPSLAIGLFAGLRSAEIERLEWKDIDLKQEHIIVGADKAKTATRRVVPIAKNLGEWLKPYAKRTGKVWLGKWFHNAQIIAAKAAGLKWKSNAMRHSFVSYSFALCNDAGRVSGFCGNSPAIIHRHYKELCTPADAQKYFSIKPAAAVNVLPATAVVNA